ncbi:MAG: WecB/TagA/CpsF family glycosyltransferase, partial [Longimicrobiales bacterium]
ASNPEKNFFVLQNKDLYETYRNADLLVPDGIGVVLAARILHGLKLKRLPGVDLMWNICSLAHREGFSIYIYGSKEEVNKKAVAVLQDKYPGIRIAGRSNGYILEEKNPELVAAINRSGAQILFIALGSPRQELWPLRARSR